MLGTYRQPVVWWWTGGDGLYTELLNVTWTAGKHAHEKHHINTGVYTNVVKFSDVIRKGMTLSPINALIKK